MESKKSSILDFLANKNVVEVPFWQREFEWNEIQLNQLYEDVDSIIRNDKIDSHFFGIIITKTNSANSFKDVKIVDGHQRLIAISLFLCAICDFYKAKSHKYAFLYTQDSTDAGMNTKIKYQNLNSFDYENIVLRSKAVKNANMIYFKTYHYFLDKIKTSKYKMENYFDTMKKFEIIELQLSSYDNEQLIFDSMNSTGLKLSRLDKFKNYIYMSLATDKQAELWREYWHPLEEMFDKNEDYFVQFMISYITMQTGENISEINLDNAFNRFYNLKIKYKKPEDIIRELFKFSQYFLRIKNSDFSPGIADEMEKMNALAPDASIYAFLFQIIDDFQNGLITQKILIEILQNVCEYMKTAVDKDEHINFADLSNIVAKLLATKYGENSNE